MRFVAILLAALCFSGVLSEFTGPRAYGAYFPAWSQYRHQVGSKNYKFIWSDIDKSNAVDSMEYVIYSFAYIDGPNMKKAFPDTQISGDFQTFDGTTFQVFPIETIDMPIWKDVKNFKTRHPKTKVLVSIGGWNFPSADFSLMASTKENRAKFINSCVNIMNKYGFDGIDIDWEFPASEPRLNNVKLTCEQFHNISDPGGMDSDFDNFLELVKEMRAAFNSEQTITYAAPAAPDRVQKYNLSEITKYVDYFHLMVYDYFVSDINDPWANSTLPNQPVVGLDVKPDFSVSATVSAYLNGGVKPAQILMGLAFYGHSWNVAKNLPSTEWAKYQVPAVFDNGCCGPFQKTYGAKEGPVIQLCGTLGYSEIVDVYKSKFVYVEHEATQTSIAYNAQDGIWVSFNSQKALLGMVDWAEKLGLGGIFLFDVSMDLKDSKDKWYYPLTNSICVRTKGASKCPSSIQCANDCSGKGKCSDGVCACDTGYFGDDCAFKKCSADADCSNNGRCDTFGFCVCNDGFSGSDCSTARKAVCTDTSFNGFQCADDSSFSQCLSGKEVAKYTCPSGTSCQCDKASGTPCGSTASPATCLS